MEKKILLKLSGESLSGNKCYGIDKEKVLEIAKEIKECIDLGFSISIVVGGGNFWRGKDNSFITKPTTDYIGMLAIVMNALALEDIFRQVGINAKALSAIEMNKVIDFYKRDNSLDNEVIIFAAGTSNPYFSTDTAAALRAAEIDAEVILVGKTIDGVYSADPKIDKNAKKFDEITYLDILSDNLKVMDSTAISLCRDNDIHLIVFEIAKPENIVKIVKGEKIGTLIK